MNLQFKFHRSAISQKTPYLKGPILEGYDDYLARLAQIESKTSELFKTGLMTSDFEDAYTKRSELHLQKSIEEISEIL